MENESIEIEMTENEYQTELKKYYMLCFVSEFSKICIYFAVFAAMGMIPEYMTALAVLMLLRCHGGGLHFSHYISCLLVSFAFLFGAVMLAKYVIVYKLVMILCIALCTLLGFFLVPVTSSNRPEATPEQIQKSKRSTVTVMLLLLFTVCICPVNIYTLIIFWTVILHILQLVAAHVRR